MYPQLRLIRLFVLLVLSVLVISYDLPGQTKKKTASKAPAKKAVTQSKATKKSTSAASKKKAPVKKATAAERRREEARRQAALAAQRRREQAAREARARKLAFERGLKNETTANILNDVVGGEDLRVRQVAIDALGNQAGTVVVMEAKTGKIVTMVNQNWAIKQGFKPCSTIKLVTGVAGLNEKLIDNDGGLANGSMQMNLDDALARSNNPYFQRVGAGLGSDKMIEYAKKLGLGQKTGINAEGETVGKLPYGNNNPRIYSHADDFEVTPLQLAVMVTAISNGGKRITPQFQRTRTEKTAFKSTYKGSVDLPEVSRMGVIPGMIGAAEYGTARRGVDANMGVAGKTGSCIGRGSWVGLFASVAPIEDPIYSVVVIIRGEGARGRHSAAVAGKIYNALSTGLKRDTEKMMALKNIRNRPFINSGSTAMPSTLAAADEDEEDEDDASSADALLQETPQRVIVAGSSQQTVQKKGVVKTSDSKPVFSPVVINYSKDGKANNSTSKPTASKPVVTKPVVSKPVVSKPVVSKPIVSKPVSKSVTKPAAKSSVVKKATTTTKANTAAKTVKNTKSTTAVKSSKSKPTASSAKTSKNSTTKKTAAANSKTKANTKTSSKAKSKTTAKAPVKPAAKTTAKTAAKTVNKKQTDGKSRPRVVKK